MDSNFIFGIVFGLVLVGACYLGVRHLRKREYRRPSDYVVMFLVVYAIMSGIFIFLKLLIERMI